MEVFNVILYLVYNIRHTWKKIVWIIKWPFFQWPNSRATRATISWSLNFFSFSALAISNSVAIRSTVKCESLNSVIVPSLVSTLNSALGNTTFFLLRSPNKYTLPLSVFKNGKSVDFKNYKFPNERNQILSSNMDLWVISD